MSGMVLVTLGNLVDDVVEDYARRAEAYSKNCLGYWSADYVESSLCVMKRLDLNATSEATPLGCVMPKL